MSNRKRTLLVVPIATILLATRAMAAPPAPLPYREIADPIDEAPRIITVTTRDRGPVWLLTGFLDGWNPKLAIGDVRPLSPQHWRDGGWPFWHPRSITIDNPQPLWNDHRDSATNWAGQFDMIRQLRKDGLTWQVLLHHKGPFYGHNRILASENAQWREHLTIVLKYARHMGLPIDFIEVENEPAVGPYDGLAKYGFWRGTWAEFLTMWDTAYEAVREVWPEAKIVGPSYGKCTAKTLEPFLAHCAEKRQKLDVLSWHEITQQEISAGPDYLGEAIVEPDKAHKNISEIRALVESKYPQLGVREIHIDEWGYTMNRTGPGTQIAYFYYFDQAGVDRSARAHWTEGDLDGLLAGQTSDRRTSYWCWAEYAKQQGGIRSVIETNDRNLIALASRHDEQQIIRVLVARAKRDTGDNFARNRPSINGELRIEGISFKRADISIIKLGPSDGPLSRNELAQITTRHTMTVTDQCLVMPFKGFEENQVFSIVVAPTNRPANKPKSAESES